MSIWVLLRLAGRWPLLHGHGRHWTRRGTQLRRLCDYLMIHDAAAGSERRRWLLLLLLLMVLMVLMVMLLNTKMHRCVLQLDRIPASPHLRIRVETKLATFSCTRASSDAVKGERGVGLCPPASRDSQRMTTFAADGQSVVAQQLSALSPESRIPSQEKSNKTHRDQPQVSGDQWCTWTWIKGRVKLGKERVPSGHSHTRAIDRPLDHAIV